MEDFEDEEWESMFEEFEEPEAKKRKTETRLFPGFFLFCTFLSHFL